MLACAFLTIAAATEHAPAPAGHIPLTRNEIARLLTALNIQQTAAPGTCCTGPRGDAATSTAPKPATTSDKPANHEHHDLRLEY
jgi:hypothetical protein